MLHDYNKPDMLITGSCLSFVHLPTLGKALKLLCVCVSLCVCADTKMLAMLLPRCRDTGNYFSLHFLLFLLCVYFFYSSSSPPISKIFPFSYNNDLHTPTSPCIYIYTYTHTHTCMYMYTYTSYISNRISV